MNIGDELPVTRTGTQSKGEELANSISHGIGLCAALIGAPMLLLKARRGDFCGHGVDVVSGINALPRVSANAPEIHPAGIRPLGSIEFCLDASKCARSR